MSLKKNEKENIKEFILKTISNAENSCKVVEHSFGISRQTIYKYIKELDEVFRVFKNKNPFL